MGRSHKPRQLTSTDFCIQSLSPKHPWQYDTANASTLVTVIFRLCFQAATRARPSPLLTTEDTRQMESHYL